MSNSVYVSRFLTWIRQKPLTMKAILSWSKKKRTRTASRLCLGKVGVEASSAPATVFAFDRSSHRHHRLQHNQKNTSENQSDNLSQSLVGEWCVALYTSHRDECQTDPRQNTPSTVQTVAHSSNVEAYSLSPSVRRHMPFVLSDICQGDKY